MAGGLGTADGPMVGQLPAEPRVAPRSGGCLPVSDRTTSDSRSASWPTGGRRPAGLGCGRTSRREIDMRMDGQEESSNVEDVRGMGGGGGGFSIGGRGLSIGSIVIAVIAGWIFGINPLTLLGMMGGSDGSTAVQQQQGPAPAPPKDDAGAHFVSQVLRSTEQVWTDVFRESGRTYEPPKLVLFNGSWPTACGQGQAAMGAFLCPNDQKGYIDLRFYK